jgi:endonuclease/exonuclease/phosphatase family metal-dependent hydrolase
MKLKILSWNIWINGYFDQIVDFLKNANADIIGLQEVKDDDPKRDVIGYLQKIGYQHFFAPVEKSWGGKVYRDGPAIFSKYPIINRETFILSSNDKRVAAKVDIQIKDKILHVISTHLVHTHQKESGEQAQQSANLIKILPKGKVIVMGDFNATPDSLTIKSMKKVLVDSDPSSTPTWSVYPEGCPICNPQKIDIRLDYIFTSKDASVKSFEVGNSKGSDHLPIIATVEI